MGAGASFSSTAEAGSGAAYFDGGSFLSYNQTPTSILAALASNLTVSLWINKPGGALMDLLHQHRWRWHLEEHHRSSEYSSGEIFPRYDAVRSQNFDIF